MLCVTFHKKEMESDCAGILELWCSRPAKVSYFSLLSSKSYHLRYNKSLPFTLKIETETCKLQMFCGIKQNGKPHCKVFTFWGNKHPKLQIYLRTLHQALRI